jgi:RNA polymerase sigma-70 factor (ECF subfamily)
LPLKIDTAAVFFYKIQDSMKQANTVQQDFEGILEKFSGSIRAQVLSRGLERRGIDPEDIIQEIRIRLWKRFDGEKKVVNPSSYIKKVVSSVLIDQLRKSRAEERLLRQAMQKNLDEEKPPGERDAGENLRRTLEEAVDSLIESRRKAVKLFLLNLTVEEISSALRWTQDKTRNLLYRGLSDLKIELKKRGVEYED